MNSTVNELTSMDMDMVPLPDTDSQCTHHSSTLALTNSVKAPLQGGDLLFRTTIALLRTIRVNIQACPNRAITEVPRTAGARLVVPSRLLLIAVSKVGTRGTRQNNVQ